MIIKKEKLIDKIVKKDYNNELEEVLNTKMYKEDVKNLLLDILYKVETSYKDYEKVKVNVLSKEKYVENIINVIKNDCNSIRFIRPNGEENVENRTFIVNKERKEILCYPIARKLLYCISKIQKSEDIIKTEIDLLNKTLTNTINVGNNINTVEPLRDFNGFSWNISVFEIENLYYNLIYQDLIILVGNQILEEWANKNENMIDYMELFEADLERRYGKRLSHNIVDLLKKLSVLLELSVNKNLKNLMKEQKKVVEKELEQMQDREKYLVKLCNQKKDIIKQIKNIDIIINNKELLNKEYSKRNEKLPLEEKIFSIRILTQKLREEREEAMAELTKCNDLMASKKFLEKQKRLQYEEKYLKLVDTENLNESILEEIIDLQKQVLRCLKIKAKKATHKNDILKIIYELRYFSLLPVTSEKKLEEINKISRLLTDTKKEILGKAQELNAINEVFKETKLNNEVLKYIFSLEIISLEDIYIKIIKEKDGLYIQFFDEDIIDEKFKMNFEYKEEELRIKINKKIKLFL